MKASKVLEDELERAFGFKAFRPGQREVIEALLRGNSALAVFPTGGGKSLCYQLPAVVEDGLTVVVSPLLALMKDQVEALQKRGIVARRLDSTLSSEEYVAICKELRKGGVKLLYVAPERLSNKHLQSLLSEVPLALLAIDEAHCISEWGHAFRPDYLKLVQVYRDLKFPRCLCLTATATEKVSRDICEQFDIEVANWYQTGFRRENLALRVTPCSSEERDVLLLKRLGERKCEGATIIYVTRQQTAERVAGMLRDKSDLEARPYHAGLQMDVREEVQEQFMEGNLQVVVATIAFGMGVDKGDVRYIYHYNLPKSLENYAQEIGRAGRDGEPAFCEALSCLEDCRVLENFIYGYSPEEDSLKAFFDRFYWKEQEVELSVWEISRSCDLRPVVVETILSYLEGENYIKSLGTRATLYSAKFVRSEEDILRGFSAERKDFLKMLFAAGGQGRLWRHYQVDETVASLGCEADKIVKSLEWLETHGDIILQRKKMCKKYLFLKDGDAREHRLALIQRFQELFRKREEQDLMRLQQVLDFFTSGDCLMAEMQAYFGEKNALSCGKCQSCQDGAERMLPSPPNIEISERELLLIHSLQAEGHIALRSPKSFARFLCGLSGPGIDMAKLKKHDAFGALGRHSFADVYAHTLAIGGKRSTFI